MSHISKASLNPIKRFADSRKMNIQNKSPGIGIGESFTYNDPQYTLMQYIASLKVTTKPILLKAFALLIGKKEWTNPYALQKLFNNIYDNKFGSETLVLKALVESLAKINLTYDVHYFFICCIEEQKFGTDPTVLRVLAELIGKIDWEDFNVQIHLIKFINNQKFGRDPNVLIALIDSISKLKWSRKFQMDLINCINEQKFGTDPRVLKVLAELIGKIDWEDFYDQMDHLIQLINNQKFGREPSVLIALIGSLGKLIFSGESQIGFICCINEQKFGTDAGVLKALAELIAHIKWTNPYVYCSIISFICDRKNDLGACIVVSLINSVSKLNYWLHDVQLDLVKYINAQKFGTNSSVLKALAELIAQIKWTNQTALMLLFYNIGHNKFGTDVHFLKPFVESMTNINVSHTLAQENLIACIRNEKFGTDPNVLKILAELIGKNEWNYPGAQITLINLVEGQKFGTDESVLITLISSLGKLKWTDEPQMQLINCIRDQKFGTHASVLKALAELIAQIKWTNQSAFQELFYNIYYGKFGADLHILKPFVESMTNIDVSHPLAQQNLIFCINTEKFGNDSSTLKILAELIAKMEWNYPGPQIALITLIEGQKFGTDESVLISLISSLGKLKWTDEPQIQLIYCIKDQKFGTHASVLKALAELIAQIKWTNQSVLQELFFNIYHDKFGVDVYVLKPFVESMAKINLSDPIVQQNLIACMSNEKFGTDPIVLKILAELIGKIEWSYPEAQIALINLIESQKFSTDSSVLIILINSLAKLKWNDQAQLALINCIDGQKFGTNSILLRSLAGLIAQIKWTNEQAIHFLITRCIYNQRFSTDVSVLNTLAESMGSMNINYISQRDLLITILYKKLGLKSSENMKLLSKLLSPEIFEAIFLGNKPLIINNLEDFIIPCIYTQKSEYYESLRILMRQLPISQKLFYTIKKFLIIQNMGEALFDLIFTQQLVLDNSSTDDSELLGLAELFADSEELVPNGFNNGFINELDELLSSELLISQDILDSVTQFMRAFASFIFKCSNSGLEDIQENSYFHYLNGGWKLLFLEKTLKEDFAHSLLDYPHNINNHNINNQNLMNKIKPENITFYKLNGESDFLAEFCPLGDASNSKLYPLFMRGVILKYVHLEAKKISRKLHLFLKEKLIEETCVNLSEEQRNELNDILFKSITQLGRESVSSNIELKKNYNDILCPNNLNSENIATVEQELQVKVTYLTNHLMDNFCKIGEDIDIEKLFFIVIIIGQLSSAACFGWVKETNIESENESNVFYRALAFQLFKKLEDTIRNNFDKILRSQNYHILTERISAVSQSLDWINQGRCMQEILGNYLSNPNFRSIINKFL